MKFRRNYFGNHEERDKKKKIEFWVLYLWYFLDYSFVSFFGFCWNWNLEPTEPTVNWDVLKCIKWWLGFHSPEYIEIWELECCTSFFFHSLAIKLWILGALTWLIKYSREVIGDQTFLCPGKCMSFSSSRKSFALYFFILEATLFQTAEWQRKLLFFYGLHYGWWKDEHVQNDSWLHL